MSHLCPCLRRLVVELGSPGDCNGAGSADYAIEGSRGWSAGNSTHMQQEINCPTCLVLLDQALEKGLVGVDGREFFKLNPPMWRGG